MMNAAAISEREIISLMGVDSQCQKAKISKLAIASVIFGVSGPFFSGVMWVVSCNNFLTTASPLVIAPFSCGVAWILGLVFGMRALKQIESDQGQLAGKEYAIVGIIISAAWMLLVFMAVFLPMIYAVNS